MRSKINRTFLGTPSSERLLAELRRRRNPDLLTVRLTASPPDFGYVYGEGQFPAGTVTEIGAVPYRGYEFLRWSDGVIQAIRPRFTVRENRDISAYFGPDVTGTIEFNSLY